MSKQGERFSGLISDEQRSHVDWIADVCNDPLTGTILFGYCTAIAVEHQDWSWWRVIEEAHKRFVVKRQNMGKPS